MIIYDLSSFLFSSLHSRWFCLMLIFSSNFSFVTSIYQLFEDYLFIDCYIIILLYKYIVNNCDLIWDILGCFRVASFEWIYRTRLSVPAYLFGSQAWWWLSCTVRSIKRRFGNGKHSAGRQATSFSTACTIIGHLLGIIIINRCCCKPLPIPVS